MAQYSLRNANMELIQASDNPHKLFDLTDGTDNMLVYQHTLTQTLRIVRLDGVIYFVYSDGTLIPKQ